MGRFERGNERERYLAFITEERFIEEFVRVLDMELWWHQQLVGASHEL